MKHLRKIPIIKWVVGALAVVLGVAWWLWRRLVIAQARIRIDSQIRKAKDANQKAARLILKGHREKGRELAIEAEKRNVYYANKREKVRAKAANFQSLSEAVNKAFSPSD